MYNAHVALTDLYWC